MATVTRLNLTDIRVLQNVTITEFSATAVAGTLATGQSFRITGVGLAAPDATGLATAGTVTGLQINIPPSGYNANSIAIADLLMPMSELRGYIAGNQVDGFLFSALAGNDTLSGYYDFFDQITGYGGDDRILVYSFHAGDDTFNAGPGNDTFVLSDQQILGGTLNGGDGVDTVLLQNAVLMNARLNGVERVVFSELAQYQLQIDYRVAIDDGAVTFVGSALANTLWVTNVNGPIDSVHFTFENWSAQDRFIFSGGGGRDRRCGRRLSYGRNGGDAPEWRRRQRHACSRAGPGQHELVRWRRGR